MNGFVPWTAVVRSLACAAAVELLGMAAVRIGLLRFAAVRPGIPHSVKSQQAIPHRGESRQPPSSPRRSLGCVYDVALRIADAVYHQRTRLGLLQHELAERANVSRHTVVNIEGGRRGRPHGRHPPGTLSKVFDALGLQISVFSKQELPSQPSEDAKAARERFRSRFYGGR